MKLEPGLKACFQIDAIFKYDTYDFNIFPFWSQPMDVLSSNGNHWNKYEVRFLIFNQKYSHVNKDFEGITSYDR